MSFKFCCYYNCHQVAYDSFENPKKDINISLNPILDKTMYHLVNKKRSGQMEKFKYIKLRLA
uniref:Uncharacterized protein n=1 Tax=Solanum lycopersicum TaxID=4081 RepID=A0A3Q7HK88_SOLLC